LNVTIHTATSGSLHKLWTWSSNKSWYAQSSNVRSRFVGSSNLNITVHAATSGSVHKLWLWSSNKSWYANSSNVRFRFQASSLAYQSYKHSANAALHTFNVANYATSTNVIARFANSANVRSRFLASTASFATNWTDLTDGGATTLHSHAGAASAPGGSFTANIGSDFTYGISGVKFVSSQKISGGTIRSRFINTGPIVISGENALIISGNAKFNAALKGNYLTYDVDHGHNKDGSLVLHYKSSSKRAWTDVMPGFIMTDGTYECGLLRNFEHEKSGLRLDMGWGGANGGNFELYHKLNSERPGEFRITYGGGGFGYVPFIHYNGTTWNTKGGVNENGRWAFGVSGAYFPGKLTSLAPALQYPVEIFGENQSRQIYFSKIGDIHTSGIITTTVNFNGPLSGLRVSSNTIRTNSISSQSISGGTLKNTTIYTSLITDSDRLISPNSIQFSNDEIKISCYDRHIIDIGGDDRRIHIRSGSIWGHKDGTTLGYSIDPVFGIAINSPTSFTAGYWLQVWGDISGNSLTTNNISSNIIKTKCVSSQGKISGQWVTPLYGSLTAAGAASTRPGQIIRTSGNADGTWVWISVYNGSAYQWNQLTYAKA
jgi:hypothetical protein